jgi:hypothetical protein
VGLEPGFGRGAWTALLLFFAIGVVSLRTYASSELSALIACHEALVDRSDGTSQKMSMDQSTPFVFQKGHTFYFVTDTGISTLENGHNMHGGGTTFVVSLMDHGKAFTQDVEVRKDGSLGSVCCEAHPNRYPVADTRANLGPESLGALKSELAARLKTVESSYQNKDAKMNIVGALKMCEGVDFGSADPVGKLLKKYQSRTRGVDKNDAGAYRGKR